MPIHLINPGCEEIPGLKAETTVTAGGSAAAMGIVAVSLSAILEKLSYCS